MAGRNDNLRKTGNQPNGFTTVELIVTIIIVGILAATVGSRLISTSVFDSRAFYDRSLTVVNYAQKEAIARRTTVFVCIGATTISASYAAGCSTPLPDPVTGGPMSFTAPSGVTLSPAGNFSFDGLGQPSTGTTIAFISTIPNDPARQIVVETGTGYAHP